MCTKIKFIVNNFDTAVYACIKEIMYTKIKFIVNNFDTDIKNTYIKEKCVYTNKNYCKNNFDTDIAPHNCPSDYHISISAVNTSITMELAPKKISVFWNHEVYFRQVQTFQDSLT